MKGILETPRLRLRELEPCDFGALCRVLQDPVAMTAYEHAFTDEEVRAWLGRQRERYRAYGFGLWAVQRREDGEIIGQCGLTMQERLDGGRDEQVLEVGYLFERAHWHRGYATEAARACRDYAFERLDAQEVFSIIRDTNLASQRVALRNGMTQRGVFVKHYYGVAMPHLVFSIERPAWEALRRL